MADIEAEQLQKINEQLKKEADIERGRVSESARDLIDYCNTTPDPLQQGIPRRDNPFISKGVCTIL
jgi:hypothetical protein